MCTPKNLAKQSLSAAYKEASGQIIRVANSRMSGQEGASSERQERDRTEQTVRETASASVQAVKAAGKIGAAAVRQGIRFRQGWENNLTTEESSLNGFSGNRQGNSSRDELSPPDPFVRGQELARSHAKQRTDRLRERAATAGTGQAGTPDIRPGNPTKGPRKPPAPGLRNTSARAQTAPHTASVAVQRARLLAIHTHLMAQSAVSGAKATRLKLAAVLKPMAAATKGLAATLAAGGTATLIVVFICLIAMVADSSFGIFFAAQPTGSGLALQEVVGQLSENYYAQITEIEATVPHDRIEYAPDGLTAIPWQDVLAVFATDMATAENGQPVAVLEAAQIDRLRETLFQMNPVSYRTYTEEHEEEHTIIDDEGNDTTETVTITETVLEIAIQHKAPQEMAAALGFTARQTEQLTLLSDPQYHTLWMELLGGYVSGGGQIIQPGNVPVGSGLLQWPLPEAFPITSGFGERIDPITGEHDFHTGTDIAAPAGTPILAAADGTVTFANGTDTWGGGYGYYIKIGHGNGMETLYAHCSAICVTPGQTIRQGEVVGFVGSTGNSTGNHLHFEMWVDGIRKDPIQEWTSS